MAATDPPDVAAYLRELAAALGDYPVSSAEAAALAMFAEDRVRSLLAQLPARPKVHCARCRREVTTEVGQQARMN